MITLETLWYSYMEEVLDVECEDIEDVEIDQKILLNYNGRTYGVASVISKYPCKIKRIE